MAQKTDSVGMPYDVLRTVSVLLKCNITNSSTHGYSSEALAVLQRCYDSSTRKGKDTWHLRVEHYGKDHPWTTMLFDILSLGFSNAFEINEVITDTQYSKLMKRLTRWRKHGSFVLPRTPRTVLASNEKLVILPRSLLYFMGQLIEYRENDPSHYELGQTEIDALKACLGSAVLKPDDTAQLTLAHYGAGSTTTEALKDVLVAAIYECHIGDYIDSITRSKLTDNILRWFTSSSIQLPKKPVLSGTDKNQHKATEALRGKVESEVHSMIAHAFNLLRQPASPVVTTKQLHDACAIKISWSASRRVSNAGLRNNTPWLSLALWNRVGRHIDNGDSAFLHGASEQVFDEYAHIRQSKTIGSCRGSWRVIVAAVVAHEVAHVAQDAGAYASTGGAVNLKKLTRKDLLVPHGLGWQEIYRYLRVNWVNKLDGYIGGAA